MKKQKSESPTPYTKGKQYQFGRTRTVYECICCDDETAVFVRVAPNGSKLYSDMHARSQDMAIEKGTYTEL